MLHQTSEKNCSRVCCKSLQLKKALEGATSMSLSALPTNTSLMPAGERICSAKVSRHIQPTPMNALCAASVRAVCQKPEKRGGAGTGVVVVSALSQTKEGGNNSRQKHAVPAIPKLGKTTQQV